MRPDRIRKEKYDIGYVLKRVFPGNRLSGSRVKILFDGDLINMGRSTFKVFKTMGVKCVSCGLEGKYFIKEKDPGDPFFTLNLYGINNKGEEIMMTKDHIIPRAQGGSDDLENFQVMCQRCNLSKGSGLSEEELEERKKILAGGGDF